MSKELRDTVLLAIEHSLDAQLRAVRRLRRGAPPRAAARSKKNMSQVDMAYAILRKAAKPMHITAMLEGIERRFGVKVDRESLVSSLTKKVARADRFVRTDKNTFAVMEDEK